MDRLEVPTSPSRQVKFDINGYFRSIKHIESPKQENFFLGEEKSSRTKNTEDNSQKDTVSLRYSETTCFKDLLNSEFGATSLLKEIK